MLTSKRKFDYLLERQRHICHCSSTPPTPTPDPLIGVAAQQNAEVAREALAFNRQVYEEGKPRIAEIDRVGKQVVDQQLEIADQNQQNAQEQYESYKRLFAPIEAQVVQDANTIGSEADQEQEASRAQAISEQQSNQADEQTDRQLFALGVNPNSERFATSRRERISKDFRARGHAESRVRRRCSDNRRAAAA